MSEVTSLPAAHVLLSAMLTVAAAEVEDVVVVTACTRVRHDVVAVEYS